MQKIVQLTSVHHRCQTSMVLPSLPPWCYGGKRNPDGVYLTHVMQVHNTGVSAGMGVSAETTKSFLVRMWLENWLQNDNWLEHWLENSPENGR